MNSGPEGRIGRYGVGLKGGSSAMADSNAAALSTAEPIKIGWLGSALDGPGGGYDKIHRMAFDEAIEQGLLDRQVEFVLHAEKGLPNGSARNAIEGFRYLVDQGCIGVAGAYSSDNAIVVAPLANELQIPLISWAGTERLAGEYCFRLGNGDCGGDAALCVSWLARQGYKRIAVLSEVSPNGDEYFRFFRQECRRHDLSIVALETVSQHPANLADNLDTLRQSNPDALCYMGYGMLAAQGLLRKALDELAWDPPRIMSTAFMFYLMGFEKFEGWVGIDQLHPDNPSVEGFHQRYVDRYGESPPMWPNAIPALAYDTARVLAEGLFRAPTLSGPGLKDGLERIRFMRSTVGGPRTHIAAAPYEHGMLRGDWLLYGRVRDAKLEFEGVFEG
jgi:branched-chain amino acid transport system substrate-binding protein